MSADRQFKYIGGEKSSACQNSGFYKLIEKHVAKFDFGKSETNEEQLKQVKNEIKKHLDHNYDRSKLSVKQLNQIVRNRKKDIHMRKQQADLEETKGQVEYDSSIFKKLNC